MTSLNSSELFQITLLYFPAALTSTVIRVYFMFEILERCIDLCIVSHTVLNSIIGHGMGGKDVSTVGKISIPNNWITRPTKVGIIWFFPECILRSNFQIAYICWKCPSHFLFWMTTEFLVEGFLDWFLLKVNYVSRS